MSDCSSPQPDNWTPLWVLRILPILLADIERLEVRGWPDRRLYIYKEGGLSINFEIENPEDRLQEMRGFILSQKPKHAFMDSRTELDFSSVPFDFVNPMDRRSSRDTHFY